MSAQTLLVKAVEYDNAGRRLEALKLYEDGIRQLLEICKDESDALKKQKYQQKIKEYIERAELIKTTIQRCSTLGEIVDRIHIVENATGYGYERIFAKYFDDNVREIEIEEPYLRESYQLSNFVIFLELAVKKCRNLKFVRLLTIKTKDNRQEQQNTAFISLQKNLAEKKIQLNVEYSENIHDRQIILSNGFIIKIGRGLNYFKPTNGKYVLGCYDFDYRECRETNVDIFKCKQ